MSAFLGFVGIFLVGDRAVRTELEAERTRHALEQRLAPLTRPDAPPPADPVESGHISELYREAVVLFVTAALALLVALALAMGVGDVRWLGGGLFFVGCAPVIGFGNLAPVLPMFAGAVLAQVPDRYFRRQRSDRS